MITFALQPIIVLFLTQIVHKNDIVVDVAFIHYVLDSILYAIIFAMIWMRKKATRSVAIAVLILDISLTIIDYYIKMGFHPDGPQFSDLLQGVVVNLLLLVYFLVSRRVKYACTRPLHTSDQVVEFDKARLLN